VSLIKTLCEQSTGEDDIVLDFFAGSGTTGQAVVELNDECGGSRRFILVQLPEPIPASKYPSVSALARERLCRFFGKRFQISQVLEADRIGFRSYRLSTSNFKTWNADYELANEAAIAEQLRLHTDHVLPDRSQEDILFEILLKAGYPLTSRVEEIAAPEQRVFSISDGNLIICLESAILTETLRAIIGLKPRPVQVICLDHAFEGNDQVKTNLKLEMQAAGIEFRTV